MTKKRILKKHGAKRVPTAYPSCVTLAGTYLLYLPTGRHGRKRTVARLREKALAGVEGELLPC